MQGANENRILTIPNLLSFFRICLIPLLLWLYLKKKDTALTVAVLLVSGATDVADGWIARRFRMGSRLGRIIDPLADKLTQAALLFCLVVRFHAMAFPLLMLAVKEITISLTNLTIMRRTGDVPGAGWHGKLATVLLYAALFFHIVLPEMPSAASVGLIAAATAALALSFCLYLRRNLRVLRKKAP